ncbi:hypothetical protein PGB90_007191 [Kerria lacca]
MNKLKNKIKKVIETFIFCNSIRCNGMAKMVFRKNSFILISNTEFAFHSHLIVGY